MLKRFITPMLVHAHALPSFIIAGTQKGGTSSLFHYLDEHPRIVAAQRKEVHFFDTNYQRGDKWYRSHFPTTRELARGGAITGETSPYYMYHPHSARRIAQHLPSVKLIMCLRNPVDRAISHYWHERNTLGTETLPMEEAFEREAERLAGEHERMLGDDRYLSFVHQHFSYLDRGKYAEQIARFLKYFERAQMLFIRSEDLFANPQRSLDRVTAFLGLDPHELRNATPRNVGSYDDDPTSELRQQLASYFEPHNQRLYELLEFERPWWSTRKV